MDIVRGEWVEKELDHLIERRAEQRIRENGRTASQDAATARAQEELWPIRRYNEQQRRAIVAAWFAYFCRMADSHRALSEDYERRAEALCEEGGNNGAR